MQFSALFAAVALSMTAGNALAGELVQARSAAHHEQYVKRAHLEARDALWATLSPTIQEDLSKRDPSEYKLHYEHMLPRDLQEGMFQSDFDQPWQARDGDYDDDEEELLSRDFLEKRQAVRFSAGGPAHDVEATWVNGHGPGIGQCGAGKSPAVTFDDGPYNWHQEIGDAFVNSGRGKATFFLNGQNFNCIYNLPFPSQMRHNYDAGHTFASHTWGHVNLTNFLTAEQIDKQIHLLEDATWKILGVAPAFIRTPYGESNRTLNAYLKSKHGLTNVQWNRDAQDGASAPPADSIAMYKQIKKGDNILALNHETHETTAKQVVPALLKHFQKIDVKSAGVGACMKTPLPRYKVTGKRQKRDASWTCDGKPLPGQVN